MEARDFLRLYSELLGSGALDNHLESVIVAARNRAEAAAQMRALELKPGDMVRLKRNARPKYLSGRYGVVVSATLSGVVLDMESGAVGRFGRRITCPPVIVERA